MLMNDQGGYHDGNLHNIDGGGDLYRFQTGNKFMGHTSNLDDRGRNFSHPQYLGSLSSSSDQLDLDANFHASALTNSTYGGVDVNLIERDQIPQPFNLADQNFALNPFAPVEGYFLPQPTDEVPLESYPEYGALVRCVLAVRTCNGRNLRFDALSREFGLPENYIAMALTKICDIIGVRNIDMGLNVEHLMNAVRIFFRHTHLLRQQQMDPAAGMLSYKKQSNKMLNIRDDMERLGTRYRLGTSTGQIPSMTSWGASGNAISGAVAGAGAGSLQAHLGTASIEATARSVGSDFTPRVGAGEFTPRGMDMGMGTAQSTGRMNSAAKAFQPAAPADFQVLNDTQPLLQSLAHQSSHVQMPPGGAPNANPSANADASIISPRGADGPPNDAGRDLQQNESQHQGSSHSGGDANFNGGAHDGSFNFSNMLPKTSSTNNVSVGTSPGNRSDVIQGYVLPSMPTSARESTASTSSSTSLPSNPNQANARQPSSSNSSSILASYQQFWESSLSLFEAIASPGTSCTACVDGLAGENERPALNRRLESSLNQYCISLAELSAVVLSNSSPSLALALDVVAEVRISQLSYPLSSSKQIKWIIIPI